MRPELLIRRAAHGIVVLCAAGMAWVSVRHDWPDAVMIGLFGAWALVTARKMAWKLRQDPLNTGYPMWSVCTSSSPTSAPDAAPFK